MSAVEMVRPDGLSVDPEHWSERQAGIIRFAAEEPQVTLIFVNAAIKKALCEKHAGEPWMNKVRPWWGHDYHFHVRIRCPEGADGVPEPGAAAARRRLRQIAQLVVHRRGAASQARQAEPAAEDGATSRRMPEPGGGEPACRAAAPVAAVARRGDK